MLRITFLITAQLASTLSTLVERIGPIVDTSTRHCIVKTKKQTNV